MQLGTLKIQSPSPANHGIIIERWHSCIVVYEEKQEDFHSWKPNPTILRVSSQAINTEAMQAYWQL